MPPDSCVLASGHGRAAHYGWSTLPKVVFLCPLRCAIQMRVCCMLQTHVHRQKCWGNIRQPRTHHEVCALNCCRLLCICVCECVGVCALLHVWCSSDGRRAVCAAQLEANRAPLLGGAVRASTTSHCRWGSCHSNHSHTWAGGIVLRGRCGAFGVLAVACSRPSGPCTPHVECCTMCTGLVWGAPLHVCSFACLPACLSFVFAAFIWHDCVPAAVESALVCGNAPCLLFLLCLVVAVVMHAVLAAALRAPIC